MEFPMMNLVNIRKALTNACIHSGATNKMKVAFGQSIDVAVLEAADPIVAQGVQAKWLCEGTVPAVDTLAAVKQFLTDNEGVDVAKLQSQFSRQQVLEGLTAEQIASLKPSVAAEPEATQPVVAETPKVTEPPVKCRLEKHLPPQPANTMAVPNALLAREILEKENAAKKDDDPTKMKPGFPLTRELIRSLARQECRVSPQQMKSGQFVKLLDALKAFDEAQATEAERQEGIAKWITFRNALQLGDIKPWFKTEKQRCKCCNYVVNASEIRYPPVQVIVANTVVKIKELDSEGNVVLGKDNKPVMVAKTNARGEVIHPIPTPEATRVRFATCLACQKVEEKNGIDASTWMSDEVMVASINDAIALDSAQRAASQKLWEQRNAQQNTGGRGKMGDGFCFEDMNRKGGRGDQRRGGTHGKGKKAEPQANEDVGSSSQLAADLADQ